MKDLSEQDERTIRQFLQWCLDDGLYAFEIESAVYLLESTKDIERISNAIQAATPPVRHYRLRQAKQWLDNCDQHSLPAALAAV
jgi:hypothetical protein